MKKYLTKIIFLWHMHQPFYKHPHQDIYLLPWVRLHATKDYYGMAKLVEKFEKVKVDINFSGVLLSQLLDYAQNNAKDKYLILTLKNPNYLKKEEKKFIIERFFSVNFERFIRPNPYFLKLYNKKQGKEKFTSSEIRDLQALFNLCWFHPYLVKEDKNLKELILKRKNYTEEDKHYIIKKQYEAISQIFPLYKKLFLEKRIELSITPYHHPIMPLIYDTNILDEFPHLKKPPSPYQAASDCLWHLQKAKEIFEKIFKKIPLGSWPSEGSISKEVVSLYQKKGFKWIATDEDILFKSLVSEYVSYEMIKKERHLIYHSYKFEEINIFFRDKNLSDAISFIYQGWEDPVFAANDLLGHFKRIHYYMNDFSKERVIVIAMDGENAWEYYKNNGVEFLETIYSGLEKSSLLYTTTFSDYLRHHKSKPLENLASGSWINADFGVWIGSQKNNFYWYILKRIKDLIERVKDEESQQQLKEYLYLLEGSDWFWWNTFFDETGDFRRIFLLYVEKIYQLLNKRVPFYFYRK